MAPERALKTAAQTQQLVEQYYIDCQGTPLLDANGDVVTCKAGIIYEPGKEAKPLTITGLCLALGFSSRNTLADYIARGKADTATATETDKSIADILTRARLKIEDYAASRLYDKDGCNGAKFTLASNFQGWSDKQDVNVTGNVIKVELTDD